MIYKRIDEDRNYFQYIEKKGKLVRYFDSDYVDKWKDIEGDYVDWEEYIATDLTYEEAMLIDSL